MAYEQRDSSGILFRNDKKTKGTDRDYGGSATIAGVEYWISGWLRDGRNGKFMSFSFKPKQEALSSAPKKVAADLSDEIPF